MTKVSGSVRRVERINVESNGKVPRVERIQIDFPNVFLIKDPVHSTEFGH